MYVVLSQSEARNVVSYIIDVLVRVGLHINLDCLQLK